MDKLGLTLLESKVIEMLLWGNDPVLAELRQQLASVTSVSRETTGYGFYLNFIIPRNIEGVNNQFLVKPDFCFGDVDANIDSLKHGAGFLLWIKNGILATLEGYTYDEEWPNFIELFTLQYQSGNSRNFEKIRESWTKNQ